MSKNTRTTTRDAARIYSAVAKRNGGAGPEGELRRPARRRCKAQRGCPGFGFDGASQEVDALSTSPRAPEAMPPPPQYPTIGEALRAVADALEADLSEQQRGALGRLAHEEHDPAAAAASEEAITQRLIQSVPKPYRAWWGAALEREMVEYRRHVCDQPIGPRSRAGAVLAWIDERSLSWALPPDLRCDRPLPPESVPESLVDRVLLWLSEAAGGSLDDLAEAVDSVNKYSLMRKWRTWKNGTPPSRSSIHALAAAGLRAPGGDPIPQDLIEGRLLAARALQHAQNQIEALHREARSAGIDFEPGTPPALERVISLSAPRRPKRDGDDERLREAIAALEGEGDTYDFVAALGRGRLHAQSGRYADAVAAYEEAWDRGIYRAGNLLREILREGLAVAAACDRRVPFRRLYGTAHRFGLLETSYDALYNEERLDAVMVRWAQKVPAVFPHPFPGTKARTATGDRLEGSLVEPELWNRRKNGDVSQTRTVKVTQRNVNSALSGFGQRALTPIVIAAQAGDADEVDRVLRLGANPNWTASDGSTALLRALQACEQTEGMERDRFTRTVRRLLEEKLKPSINARTVERRVTTLGAAVTAALPAEASAILDKGADVDGRHGVEDATPLYWALQSWAYGICEAEDFGALLREETRRGPAGAEATLRAPGVPPLFADEARRSRVGMTHSSVFDPVVAMLLERWQNRESAFAESVCVLLNHGADPNAKHANGFTPLLFSLKLYAGLSRLPRWNTERRGVLRDLLVAMVKAGGDLGSEALDGKSGWDYVNEADDPALLLRLVPQSER